MSQLRKTKTKKIIKKNKNPAKLFLLSFFLKKITQTFFAIFFSKKDI
tara:strand:- start:3444 stop:3584 length:141 start_codon:yes stop_codon:yes gene_type:complete